MEEIEILKEIMIDNLIIEIEVRKSGYDDDPTVIKIKKYLENGFGHIDKTRPDDISKTDAYSILNDIGKWEDFIFVFQNAFGDSGLRMDKSENNKSITSKEFEYDERSTTDLQVFKIYKNRITRRITSNDISNDDIIECFNNIKKWKKLKSLKNELLFSKFLR